MIHKWLVRAFDLQQPKPGLRRGIENHSIRTCAKIAEASMQHKTTLLHMHRASYFSHSFEVCIHCSVFKLLPLLDRRNLAEVIDTKSEFRNALVAILFTMTLLKFDEVSFCGIFAT